jgi:mannose-6-phosphate isomerase-like protein (cupin superfamily)
VTQAPLKLGAAAAHVIDEADAPLEGWDDPARGAVTWRTLVSGDRAPTRDLTLGVAEVLPANAGRARLHRHAQAEVYYILAGTGVISIDGVEHPLVPGTCAFVPGDALHGAWATGEAPLRILYVFAADAFDQIQYRFPDAG